MGRFELAKTTHLIRRIRSLLSRQPVLEAEADAETDLGAIDPSIDVDTTDDWDHHTSHHTSHHTTNKGGRGGRGGRGKKDGRRRRQSASTVVRRLQSRPDKVYDLEQAEVVLDSASSDQIAVILDAIQTSFGIINRKAAHKTAKYLGRLETLKNNGTALWTTARARLPS